jgi:hypothetical protein
MTEIYGVNGANEVNEWNERIGYRQHQPHQLEGVKESEIV